MRTASVPSNRARDAAGVRSSRRDTVYMCGLAPYRTAGSTATGQGRNISVGDSARLILNVGVAEGSCEYT